MVKLVLLSLLLLSLGCAPRIRINVPESQRSATVRVDAALPDDVKAAFIETVQRSRLPDRLGELGVGWTSHGSGFLVREAPEEDIVLITNRHVVDSAAEVRLVLDDHTSIDKCEVLYVDDRFDLAVVALPGGAASRSIPVVQLSDREIADNEAVQAAGYPVVDRSKPSYRNTPGTVSNSKFTIPLDGRDEVFIQHTAAIDPGSSGGPLFKAGSIEVIGVNTLAIPANRNLFSAIPASVVRKVIRRALVTPRPHDIERSARLLTRTCEDLTDEMTIGGAPPRSTLAMLSDRLIASIGMPTWEAQHVRVRPARKIRRGGPSQPEIEIDKDALSELLEHIDRGSVMDYLRGYAFALLYADVSTNGSVRRGSCENLVDKDLNDYEQRKSVRIRIDFESGRHRTLSWRFEQGHWRLINYQ